MHVCVLENLCERSCGCVKSALDSVELLYNPCTDNQVVDVVVVVVVVFDVFVVFVVDFFSVVLLLTLPIFCIAVCRHNHDKDQNFLK